jgi:hypothetical protein
LPYFSTRLAVLVFGEELLRLERRVARIDDDVVLEVDDPLEAVVFISSSVARAGWASP